MKKLILFCAVILLSLQYSFSQFVESKNWCPSQCHLAGDEKINTDLLYLKLKNGHFKQARNSAELKRIPLRIGIVQEDDAKLEVAEREIRLAVDNLNTSFHESNFVFFIARIDIITSDLKLEDLSLNYYDLYDAFSEVYDLEEMISVYVFDHNQHFCEVSEHSISCGRTGGFSYILSERTNNILLSRFDLSDIKVFAHEMGHFWGLYHTFEEDQYGKDDFDMEQCHEVGDRLCDTPPDPGAVYEVYVNYTTCELMNLQSPEGHDYKPLIENYMSYYKPCYMKEFRFTEDQISLMQLASNQPMRAKFIR